MRLFARPLLVLLFVVLALTARPVRAHPMGNFSISHYTAFTFEPNYVIVEFRIDFAEVPTVDELRALDADGNQSVSQEEKRNYLVSRVEAFATGQTLTIDGKPAKLIPIISDLEIGAGAADLPVLRTAVRYRVDMPDAERFTVQYRDDTYAGRSGWREIIAVPNDYYTLENSSVPSEDKSKALTEYPTDLSIAPPQVSEATFTVCRTKLALPTTGPAVESAPTQPTLAAPPPPNSRDDRLTRLITLKELTAGVVLVALGVAFTLGCFHALAPGHGKTVVAAYLVGSRGTPRHALLLGGVVTLTHTVGVFALGFAVLFASRYVVPEKLYPWLGFVSGLTIVVIGARQFIERYAYLRGGADPGADALAHAHGDFAHTHSGGLVAHAHDGSTHSHYIPENITLPGLIALGVSGGLVPCPSALVVLLSAVALNRVGFGLVLILAFSLGLASVLILIGLLMLYARKLIERFGFEASPLRKLPLVSPIVVAVLGLIIAFQALAAGGVIKPLFAAS